MKRGQRGSGCSFINAIVIIEASKGNSEPAWLATSSARPWAGTWRIALRLDPPPDRVQELEQREDGLGELLVESPLVLVVLAAETPDHHIDGVAQLTRQPGRRALRRGDRIETGLDPDPDVAQEVGQRLGARPAPSRPSVATLIARSRPASPASAPGCRPRPSRLPPALAAKSRTAASAS